MEISDASWTAVVYTYRPVGFTAKGTPAIAAGGASAMVSPAAVIAIKSLIVDDDGTLSMAARTTLARIDERESQATELQALGRALARRDAFIRP